MGGFRRAVGRVALAMALAATAVASGVGSIGPAAADPPPNFAVQTVLFPGNGPMAFDYAPDGRIFVGAKAGVVAVYTNGVRTTFADFRQPENNFARRNLRSIVLDPNFEVNRRLYALLTDPVFPADGGTVVRVQASVSNPNVADMSTLTVLLTGAPVTSQHVGGDLEFDLNGNLLVSNGDGFDGTFSGPDQLAAQNLDMLNGKLLRISPETGLGVPGNPYYNAGSPGSVRSKILARGFRQPFRFSVDPNTGEVLVGDVGWATWEELNVVPTTWSNADRDLNFGWPCYEGGDGVALKQPSYAANPETSAACAAIYTPAEGGTGVGSVAPIYGYLHSDPGGDFGSAIMGGPVYTGNQYPSEYVGRIFLADEARDRFQTFDRTLGVFDFGTPGTWGLPVDIEMTPQGTIAFLSWGAELMSEIVFVGGNRQPVAAGSATPNSGAPPLTVQFSSAGSSDPDNDPLSYTWDFGDGSAMSTEANPTHEYTTIGSYDAILTVSDGQPGGTDTAIVHVDVGNTPPTIAFVAPTEGATYDVGDTIDVSLFAFDDDDGELTGNSVSWEVVLHHLGHDHPPDDQFFGTTGQFVVPDHGEDTFLEIVATATDSVGASTSASRFLYPNTATLTIDARPAGVNVVLDSAEQRTPYTRSSIVGGAHQVIAPETATIGGVQYQFVAWRDGATTAVTNAYNFTTPTTGKSLKAEYQPIAPTGNLVTNPSFESGTTGFKGSKASLTTVALPNTPNGALVLKATHTSGSSYGVKVGNKQGFATTTGQAYTATAHMAAGTTAAVGTSATLTLVERSSSGAVLNQWLVTRPLTTEFQPFRVVANGLSPGSKLDLSTTVVPVGATGTNALYMDLVSLVPSTDPGPTVGLPTGNLIDNPSFETDTVGWTLQRATLTQATIAGAPDGASVGLMTLTSGTNYSAKTDVTADELLSGQLYRAGAYLRAANNDANGREVRFTVTEKSATGTVLATWTVITTIGTTFRFLSVEPVATTGGTMFEVNWRGTKTTGTPAMHGDAITLAAI